MEIHTFLSSNQVALKKSQVILPCLAIANIYLQKTRCRVTIAQLFQWKHKSYQGLGIPEMPVEYNCLKNKKTKKTKTLKKAENKIFTFWTLFFFWYCCSDLTFCTLQRTSNKRSCKLKSLYTTLPSSGAWYSEGSSSSSRSSLGSFPRDNE